MTSLALALVTGLAHAAAPVPAAGPVPVQDYDRLAPWPVVRWSGETATVEVEGREYELVAIDGTKAADVVAYCKKTWPPIWQKRFEEDLVEVFARMGRPLGRKVDLDLIDAKTRKPARLEGVAMTEENRRRLWRSRREREQGERPAREPPPRALPRADAQADLDELHAMLRDRYAYWERVRVAFERELAAARKALPASIERDDFALRVQRLLCELGDGHSQLEGLESSLPSGFLPFLVADAAGPPKDRAGERALVAFRADRSGFVDEEHPWLVALDGVPVSKWLAAAATIVPKGSPDFVRFHSIRTLRFVAWLRRELKLPASPALAVELADARGRTATRRLALGSRKPIYGSWPRTRTGFVADGIGLLRIESMDDEPEAIAAVHEAMAEFADARGLIVDVRGNGGGSRKILRELFPYLLREDDPPHVANVAWYRLPEGEARADKEGHLADRWLFPLSASVWTARERETLEPFARAFEPQWQPPSKSFSAPHFFVLSPDPRREPFVAPVIVLQDGGCFSATDILLGAFHGWRDVTLLGTQSGGGSGRAVRLRLPKSGLELRASSMASFRRDGSLYDGAGIAPDVVVEAEPGDLIGRGDAQRAAALKRLER